MYENLIADMKTSLQPMVDVAEINRRTFEKLAALQSECVTDCFNAGLKQLSVLANSNDPQAAIELQATFVRDLEVKLTNTVEQNIATVSEAKDAISEVVEQGYAIITELNVLGTIGDAFTSTPFYSAPVADTKQSVVETKPPVAEAKKPIVEAKKFEDKQPAKPPAAEAKKSEDKQPAKPSVAKKSAAKKGA